MATIGEQFSEAARQELLDRVSGRILANVISDMASNPGNGLPVEEYLQAARHIIEAASQFDGRHAQMRLLAAGNGLSATGPSPYGDIAQEQLLKAVNLVLDDIGGLLLAAAPQAGDIPAQLVTHEKAIVERAIRQRYGERNLQHGLEWGGACRGHQQPPSSQGSKSRKRPSRQPIAPVDRVLGTLEERLQRDLRLDFPGERERYAQMVERLYSLSDADLKAPVNGELAELGHKPVSSKTIQRSATYTAWRRYRRPAVPQTKAADCGPAFSKPGSREISDADVATGDVKASGLVERTGRRLRSGGRGRSAQDRMADEFARGLGVTLDPTD
jgi:hypothetical protein